jgi:hypothetical protein
VVVPYLQVLGAEQSGGQATVSYLVAKGKKDNNALKLQTIRGQVQAGGATGAASEWCEAALARAYDGQLSCHRSSVR